MSDKHANMKHLQWEIVLMKNMLPHLSLVPSPIGWLTFKCFSTDCTVDMHKSAAVGPKVNMDSQLTLVIQFMKIFYLIFLPPLLQDSTLYIV